MSNQPSKWVFIASCVLLATCSKGSDNAASQVPVPPLSTQGQVSSNSPFPSGCNSGASGTVYINSEVEPFLAVNLVNPNNLIGVWQQDRWSNGSARGLVAATSFDGGATWMLQGMPFSRCGGGTSSNGGDFERASDPWITFAPDGTAYFMSLSTSGGSFQAGSANAMLVSRSGDGGRTWSPPLALINDSNLHFNDKNSITADPTDARYVYAVWDRLPQASGGPAFFARTTNGGASWEPARAIFDPGPSAQTIGNLIVVLPSGLVVDFFTRIDEVAGQILSASVTAVRSTDHGATWSAPIRIADLLAVGASDPDTGAAIRDGSILPQAAAGPDGSLVVVWQDARFSGGARDSIALSRSTDGGTTWSAPLRVNPGTQSTAFTPSVHVRADGTIGVAYFDLRDNTSSSATLPTGYFLARSTNGLDWTETRISEPFDLTLAPSAGGLFLGDYHGLQSLGTSFIALFARTTGSVANRTDIFALRVDGNATSALTKPAPSNQTIRENEKKQAQYPGQIAGPTVVTAAFRRRVSENLIRALERPPRWVQPRKSVRLK